MIGPTPGSTRRICPDSETRLRHADGPVPRDPPGEFYPGRIESAHVFVAMGCTGADSPRRNRGPPDQMEGEGTPAVVHSRGYVLAHRATAGDCGGSEVVR